MMTSKVDEANRTEMSCRKTFKTFITTCNTFSKSRHRCETKEKGSLPSYEENDGM